MKVYKLSEMVGGWFVGNFTPTTFQTKDFEVCYKFHAKGEQWDIHTHKVSIEINYIARGKMKFQDKILEQGDIFVVYPWEISNPEFLEDCEIVIVKVPSAPGDKYPLSW